MRILRSRLPNDPCRHFCLSLGLLSAHLVSLACKLIISLANNLKKFIFIFCSLSYNFTAFPQYRLLFYCSQYFLLNRSSRMQKRTAWPRADCLINKPRFKRIGELIKSWTRVGLKRVGKSDDQILRSIAKRITLQFWGSPGVDRMLVFTLARPRLVYVRRTAAQLNLNNELRLKWGS